MVIVSLFACDVIPSYLRNELQPSFIIKRSLSLTAAVQMGQMQTPLYEHVERVCKPLQMVYKGIPGQHPVYLSPIPPLSITPSDMYGEGSIYVWWRYIAWLKKKISDGFCLCIIKYVGMCSWPKIITNVICTRNIDYPLILISPFAIRQLLQQLLIIGIFVNWWTKDVLPNRLPPWLDDVPAAVRMTLHQ